MLNYNAPDAGQDSSIDFSGNTEQFQTFKWLKKALIDARREQFFMQLTSTIGMPKHFGKKIKRYRYVPLLDARNINDQGIDANGVTISNGNLWGSSRDIGNIMGKLPKLGENGGRVNRVGFARMEVEGSIDNFGFFYEFSKDSIDFDSDDSLMEHLSREVMNGASEISEILVQMDLLAAAGVILRAGAALDDDEITGEVIGGAPASVVTYADFSRMDQILTENRVSKSTQIIAGSRNIDTKVIPACRVAYIGPEVKPLLEGLKDQFQNRAFIPVQHYAAAGNLLHGEIGTIGTFRIIEVPEMLHWAGAGAEVVTNDAGYRTTDDGVDEKFNVYPILFVGNDSFNTIGFQTDGAAFKFNIITKMPGREIADRNDPYGKTGFSSIQFWYGFLANRPEWIGVIKTVAPI